MAKRISKSPPKIALIKTGLIDRSDSKATPPLGCMYIASVLQKELGAECYILDTRLGNLTDDQVGDYIARDPPHLIGLSVMTFEAGQMHSLAAHLKERFADIPVVVGGPHASADMEDILADPNVDWLVYHEGEYTFLELVEALWKGKSANKILGTAYRRNGKTTVNPPRPYIEDLDSLPFPSWDLIDYRAYFKTPRLLLIYKNAQYMPIFTSRACPFSCIYCHNIFGKGFRYRSPQNVLAEMRELYHNYGIREFEFFDDCFNVNQARSKEILRLFAESEMRDAWLYFPNGLRTDIVDDQTIRLWKEARVFRVAIAVETASPRLQKLIKKNIRLEKIKPVASKASRQGVILHGLFMLGFPTETREELHQTIRFALDMDIDTASFFIVNPFKGTELAEMAREMGTPIDPDPARYDYFRAKFNLSRVSDEELTYLLRQANLRFYLSFKRIIRFLRILWYNPRALLNLPMIFFDRILTIKVGGGKKT